jgi:thioredoxin-related protein
MKRLAMMAVVLLAAGGAWAKPVDWVTDYDKALSDAEKNKKIIMIDFYTDWCGWCKKLDKDVYAKKEIEDKLAANFISMKLNPEKSRKAAELSKKFGTRGFPHIVFLDAKGNKISQIGGYLPAKDFGAKLDELSKANVDPAAKK